MAYGGPCDQARPSCALAHGGVALASTRGMGSLLLLAQPAFVVTWYAVGLAAAIWILYDTTHANTPVPTALKWAWPIIALFLSLAGLALYLLTSRPADIGEYRGLERQSRFEEYARPIARTVAASVNHCVGGDGLGIITAMVLARAWRFSLWEEFWFEYAAGFAFGWFIFQYQAMRTRASGPIEALWIAGRAEFFSMMTVMAGMGAVMALVTPLVVGQQPPATTAAFWGFAALGLGAGWIATVPMNYWLVSIGWKHGMT